MTGSGFQRRWRFITRTYRLELANAIEYRGSMLGWVFLGGAPVIAAYFLWQPVLEASGGSLAGYDFPRMMTYYLLASVLFQLMMPWSLNAAISQEIRAGEINRYLIRPIPYRLYRAVRFTGYNTTFVALVSPALALAIFILGDSFTFVGWPEAGLAVLALMIGYWLQFLMVYSFALVAFWWDEISTMFFMFTMVARFAMGELLPLDLLPGWCSEALRYTPFPSTIWFPLQIYFGRASPDDVVRGFATGAIWLVILFGVSSLIWRRGIRRYGAYGG